MQLVELSNLNSHDFYKLITVYEAQIQEIQEDIDKIEVQRAEILEHLDAQYASYDNSAYADACIDALEEALDSVTRIIERLANNIQHREEAIDALAKLSQAMDAINHEL